jgi:hypothetical protein
MTLRRHPHVLQVRDDDPIDFELGRRKVHLRSTFRGNLFRGQCSLFTVAWMGPYVLQVDSLPLSGLFFTIYKEESREWHFKLIEWLSDMEQVW